MKGVTSGKEHSTEEIEIKLKLVDLVSPYGVRGKELLPFTEENLAILQLPSQERKKALYDLADKIKKCYGKTKLDKTKTQRE